MSFQELDRAVQTRLRSDPLLRTVRRALDLDRVWLAGGWIRDIATGRESRDLDLVVATDPESMRRAVGRLAKELGARAHLIGRPPRAVWRIDGSVKAEIWPLPEAATPESDALRRDFTVNAMLWQLPEGPLVDPTGGLRDAGRSIVRAVSRANLEDDPVRLLRGPRIAAALTGFRLHPETRAMASELAPLVRTAPRERVGQELLTMTCMDDAGRALDEVIDLGLFSWCGPNPPEHPTAVGTLDRLALARLTGRRPHPLPSVLEEVRSLALLAWLVVAWGQPDIRTLTTLGWPQAILNPASTAAHGVQRCLDAVQRPPGFRREVLASLAHAAPTALVLAAAFDSTGRPEPWRRWWRQWRSNRNLLVHPPSLLSATDVAAGLGLEPGPALGRALAALRTAIVRGDIRSRSGAQRWLRTFDQSF